MTEKYKNGVCGGHSRSKKWQERTNHLDTCVRSELGSCMVQLLATVLVRFGGRVGQHSHLFDLVYAGVAAWD